MKAGLIEYWLEELLVAASKEGKQGDKGSIQQVSILLTFIRFGVDMNTSGLLRYHICNTKID